jgi:hypothetical protein
VLSGWWFACLVLSRINKIFDRKKPRRAEANRGRFT